MGTTAGQSITLANSIIGVGILAMPFCFQQCGVLLATLILFLMGLVSRLSCHFLLKSAIIARRRNFEFLALHVFGSGGKLAVEVGIIGFLMGTCIAYFVVVGDLGPQIIAKMFNINQSDILRTSIMVIVSLVCVLPLGLLRNVDSLSNVSAATIGFYFCLVIKVILDAASQMAGGEWHTRVVLWRPAGLLQCVPIFSMALFCQTQLFEVFESLPTISLEKMNLVTKNAINICTAVYFTLGLFGYVAFCSQTISGNILMSLSPTMGSDVIKLGFVMSLAFSFPLIIFPCRASLYSFLYKKVQAVHHDHIINHSIPKASFRCITVAIIAVALFISLLIPNIELVLGLVGSTIGVLVCIVFPTSCFIKVTFKNTNERVLAKVILVLGIVILVLGTYANLQAAENQVDKYDDNLITQERIDKIVEEFFQKNMDKQGAGIKPVSKEQTLSQDNINPIKEIIANEDSEVQPPNPVPPETHSNEEKHKIEEDKKLKETPAPPVIEPSNKSHPKNLKGKLDEAKVKLENDLKLVENKIQKNNIEMSNNIEKPKQDENKSPTNEEKSDILKKQELVETIKQHGEEQRELIKEQKEILHEIIKTQQELQKNKAEAESNEAKKIAVESIQKIANAAIQSLSGVSEKPNVENEENNIKDVPLEKIANDAVQEIAKKTIEAIKEIKEESKNNPPIVNAVVNDNVQSQNNTFKEERAKILEKALKKVLDQNVRSNQNVQPNLNVNAQDQSNVNKPIPVPAENIAQNNINTNSQQNNIQQQNQGQAAQQNIAPPSNIVQQPVPKAFTENKQDRNNLKHSHSPDEPQSYKQGEESQIKNKNEIINNVPIPIAMNGNIQNHQEAYVEPVKSVPILSNNVVANDASNTNNNRVQPNIDHDRQKREAVDCTNKNIEKEEKISDLISHQNSAEILPKVDLNDAFNKNLPLTNEIHHIRSLKSYEDNER